MDEVRTEQYQVKTAYHLVVTAELTPDEEEGGYSVYCPELDIYTQGETVEEAIANLREAAEGYIESGQFGKLSYGVTVGVAVGAGVVRAKMTSRKPSARMSCRT